MGRMINKVATYIRGKNSPHYKNSLCNIRNGDICIIVNAADPLFTGKQVLKKQLRYHTGFIGHLRTLSYR
jgi:large subunit ribosomal protein L13